MQAYPPLVQEPWPFQGRTLQSAWAWVPLQPRCSIMQPRSDGFRALALKNRLRILDGFGLQEGQPVRWWPNARASRAVFKLQRQ